jgi:hypothetical protein
VTTGILNLLDFLRRTGKKFPMTFNAIHATIPRLIYITHQYEDPGKQIISNIMSYNRNISIYVNWTYRSLLLLIILALSGCAGPPPKATYGQPEKSLPVVISAGQEAEHEVGTPEEEPLEEQQVMEPAPSLFPAAEPESPAPSLSVTPDKDAIERQLAYIELRQAAYEKKMQAWLEIQPQTDTLPERWFAAPEDSCLARLDALLTSYSSLKEQLLHEADYPEPSSPTMQKILTLDIEFLESDCGRKLAQSTLQPTAPGGAMNPELNEKVRQAENLIDRYFRQGEYAQVISVYQLLQSTYPDITPSFLTTQRYSLARLHTGAIEAAADSFKHLLTETESREDVLAPWTLQRLTADLLLATGRPGEAKAIYERLTTTANSLADESSWASRQLALMKEVDESDLQMTYYLDLLRTSLIFDTRKDNPVDLLAKADDIIQIFPNTPVADIAALIKQKVENQQTDWTDRMLTEADDLVSRKEFQQAVTLLQNMNSANLPADLRQRVQLAVQQTEEADQKEREQQRLLLEQSLADQWQSATKLLDAQRYDMSIAGFKSLLDTDYGEQARQKIQEASNLAAAEQRNESAALFVKAVKAQRPEDKKELLLESRRHLQEVLAKYPQADIIDKVTQNLETLENHIRHYDADLLEQTDNSAPPTDNAGTGFDPDRLQDRNISSDR